jgi:hypothetical protein
MADELPLHFEYADQWYDIEMECKCGGRGILTSDLTMIYRGIS